MKRVAGIVIFLLGANYLFCQDTLLDNFQHRFNIFQSHNTQEKLFVHTDKTFYLAGETIWFKVYSLDVSFHKPLSISSIAYVEILNKDLQPVLQTKIAMTNGSGNGSILLPASLGSGNYLFRTYTSWMKNFDADFFYQQPIRIVNTLKLTAVKSGMKSYATIQFFPEGGNAVIGYPVKLAFKAVGPDGFGLDCEGVVINQKNDTITRFKSLLNGMGNFSLLYEKNSSYYALLRLNDSLVRQKLPEAKDEGYTMNLTKEDSDKLKITVQVTSDFNNTDVYLFAHSRQVVKNVQATKILNNNAVFILDKKLLEDGISSITILNNLRQPVCERLVFKRPEKNFVIQAKTDLPVYENRTEVKFSLKTTDKNNRPQSGNLSLAVFQIDSLQGIPERDIISYLYLSSDLRGNIESPSYYFSNTDTLSDQAVDNLMLTQGWRRFKWSDVLDFKKPVVEFLPEIEGAVVNGKIINKRTGFPVSLAGAFLSIPGADYAFSSATSNSEGLIRFGFKDVYKNNVLVVQPAVPKDSNNRIDIVPAYSDKIPSYSFGSPPVSKNLENLLLNHSISNQVENTYRVDKKNQYVNRHLDTTAFFGIADRTYNLEDYVRFQTMEEVLREYVEDVRVRKEGNQFTFKVRNQLFGTYFEEAPLILLDGIPITDATRIVDQNPAKIQKIEVVTHNYYVGSSVFEGIINVISYSGELGASQIDPNALILEYTGLQQQREFYSPTYDAATDGQSHIPDFRNVLYWAPQIHTDPEGRTQLSFYTSDLKGKFAAVVQGLSTEGLPGESVTVFEVSSSK